MAAEKTLAEILTQIDADIRVNGNREITPPKHNAIEKALANSFPNKKDGGLVMQAAFGYTTELDLSAAPDETIPHIGFVEDAIAAAIADIEPYPDLTANTNIDMGLFDLDFLNAGNFRVYGDTLLGLQVDEDGKFYAHQGIWDNAGTARSYVPNTRKFYGVDNYEIAEMRQQGMIANWSTLGFDLDANTGAGSQAGLEFYKPGFTFGIIAGISAKGDYTFYTDDGAGAIVAAVFNSNATCSFAEGIVDYPGMDMSVDTNLRQLVANDGSTVMCDWSDPDEFDVEVDLVINSTKGYYIGDPVTNGSWRKRIDGTDLVYERREAGVWVEKDRIAA